MPSNKATPPPMKRSVVLKWKAKQLFSKLKANAKKTIAAAIAVSAASYLVIKAPEIHGQYLRWEVGSKVYMIKGKADGGGGTGFSVKAPSGQTYIVTNSHVCTHALKDSEDKQTLLVMNDAGPIMRRRVIENSDFTDLCLLEGLPGVAGLSVSNAPNMGETAYVVGHPRLRPMSVSAGEIVGKEDVQILDYIIDGPAILGFFYGFNKEGKCDLPKNVKIHVETPMGPIDACMINTAGAYLSTIVIFGGNSGSPMVDAWGNVMGVAFANDETNWAYIVSNKDLKKFLSKY